VSAAPALAPVRDPQPARRVAHEPLVLSAVLAIALVVRVREALRTPLWFDELFTLWMADHPLPEMLQLLAGDIHPPLPTLLVALWRTIGGDGTVWLKLLPVAIGLLTVAVVYGFARDLFGRRSAALSALLLALHPMHVYFSQELRSYGLLALALLLAAWGAWRWALSNRTADAALWVAGMALTLHTHYLGAVVLVFLDLWLLVALRQTPARLRGWGIAHLALLALMTPLAGVLPGQLGLSRNHWMPHPPFPAIVDYLRKEAWGAWYMIPVAGALAITAVRPRATRRAALFVLWLAAVPLAFAFVATHYGGHLYTARYWHFLAPLWCTLFAVGLGSVPDRVPRTVLAAALVLFAVRANVRWPRLTEAVELREIARTLAPRLRPGDALFCADTHSLVTLDHHLGAAHGVLLSSGTLPYYLGSALVPDARRVPVDSVFAVAASGRRWWAVRTKEGGMSTGPVAALMDSLARGGRVERDPVTLWAGRPGMLDAP
jgi:hypothetical protein